MVLQHPRERFHPVGTAPLARFGLGRCRLVVAPGGLARALDVAPIEARGTALLYPGEGAIEVGALPASERPARLIVLDGTWPQSKRLYTANPWLHTLPRLRLAPDRPSAWRVRLPPRPECLSTIESIVQALRVLEPDTPGLLAGLDALLDAFHRMNERTVAFMRAATRTPRHLRPRLRESRKLPRELFAPRLLVVHGEVPATGDAREVLHWVAAHVDGDERFESIVRSASCPPSAGQLAHIGVDPLDVARGESHLALCERFAWFAGDGAVLAAWNARTLAVARELLGRREPCVLLKAAYTNLRGGRCGHVADVTRAEGLEPVALPFRGRAAITTGHAVAVARWLRGCDHAR